MKSAELVIVDDWYSERKRREHLQEIFEGSGHTILDFLASPGALKKFLNEYTGDLEKLAFWVDGDLGYESEQQINNDRGFLVDAPDDIRNKDGINGILQIREKWSKSPPIIIGRAGRGEVAGADYQASKESMDNFEFVDFLSSL